TLQQCVSVSTDENISTWYVCFFVILSMMLIWVCILRCTSWLKPKTVPILCDATTQTDGYHEMTNQELDATIATRLDSLSFPLSLERDVVLRDNYNLRLEYKAVGARYDGTMRRWFMRAGSDLRSILNANPTWIENHELAYRESLFTVLRRILATEDLF
ncbi:MAG: hypothetical protein ACKPKO_27600, partial [Candidatus Fonsibacter sp.]